MRAVGIVSQAEFWR